MSDTISNGSEYVVSNNNFIYRLTFDELKDSGPKISKEKYSLNKKQLSFNKRMGLSFITCLPTEKVASLTRHSLGNDCYLMVRNFKRTIEESKFNIDADWGQSSENFKPLLYSILTYTLNIIKIDQLHERQKQHNIRNSKPYFIIKYVANLLQNITLAYFENLFVCWDTSMVYAESKKKKLPDYIIYTINDCEIGCVEIKSLNANTNDVEEGRCCVPEHLKKTTA